jgi:uncharacterized protein DUF6950
MHERVARTNQVLDELRHKPFSWETRANCIQLARAQLVAFDYSPPPIPQFRTALGAVRALRKRGHHSVGALIDTMLPQIPAASMIVGDLALLPGRPLEALTVYAGAGWLLGWHEDGEAGMIGIKPDAVQIIAAWRV